MSLHGALCLEIGDCPIVETWSLNAETTIEVLEKFIRQNPTRWQERVLLGHTKYHHAAIV